MNITNFTGVFFNMHKSKISLFHRISKHLVNKNVFVLSFIAVLVVGLLWILNPIISGASEIFFPGSSDYIIEILLLAVLVILFHIICFILAMFYKHSAKYLIYMIIPLYLLTAINYALYPSDTSRIDRRIDSFHLGAGYRVKWAGGATKLRNEALDMLFEASEVSPLRSMWPDSVRALRPNAVRIDKKNQLIDVEIPRRRFFSGAISLAT
jgi:hypothetical protein